VDLEASADNISRTMHVLHLNYFLVLIESAKATNPYFVAYAISSIAVGYFHSIVGEHFVTNGSSTSNEKLTLILGYRTLRSLYSKIDTN
jgi:hypothetical protein